MRIWIALLAACAVDVEPTPTDQQGPPLLFSVSDVLAGQPVTFSATGANPGDRVWFLRGDRRGPWCPTVLNGTCLDIRRVTALGSDLADASGRASLTVTVPSTVPDGIPAHFQAGVLANPTGYVSNAVEKIVGEVTVDPHIAPELLVVTGSVVQHLAPDGSVIRTIGVPVGSPRGVAWDHVANDGFWVVGNGGLGTAYKVALTGGTLATVNFQAPINQEVRGLDLWRHSSQGPQLTPISYNANNLLVIYGFNISDGRRWSEALIPGTGTSNRPWGNAVVAEPVNLDAWFSFDDGILGRRSPSVGAEWFVGGPDLRGVDTTIDDHVYVVDATAGLIRHLDADGTLVDSIPAPPSPWGLSVIEVR